MTKDLARCRACGMSRVDLLVHGITPETGGWKPFPSREAFIKYLDGIKACEQRGEIKVVPYDKLLVGARRQM